MLNDFKRCKFSYNNDSGWSVPKQFMPEIKRSCLNPVEFSDNFPGVWQIIGFLLPISADKPPSAYS